jgi:subtilisin family serine protease
MPAGLLTPSLVFLCALGPAPEPPLFRVPRRAPVVAQSLQRRLADVPNERQRVWVFFTDKAIASPRAYAAAVAREVERLTPRARLRRLHRRESLGLVDHRDLPLTPDYVGAVLATGARRRHESRWLNAMSVEAAADRIHAIAALPFVREVRPLARAARPRPDLLQSTDFGAADPIGGAPNPGDGASPPRGLVGPDYGFSFDQLAQINAVAAHQEGYTGAGVVIGVLDTGFKRTHASFNQTAGGAHPVQVLNEYDFINDDPVTSPQPGDPSDQHNHGTYILGTLGAYHPGTLVGAAFDASFLLAKTEDVSQEVPAEEDQYVAGLEWIESLGADLATSSLGYIDWYTQADLDGQTAVTTLAVNVATDNGLICCTAAGNETNDGDPGTSHLIAPADALRVLTCGAVDSTGFIAWFSSDGPTADGRVKPEALARGVSTATVSAVSDANIIGVSGTSLSTPLVAGAVALIVQAHPNWNVDRVRRALLHTASGFAVTGGYDAAYVYGYGVIDAQAAIHFVHGDVNGDGAADGDDIAPFLKALAGTNPSAAQQRRADVNADGVVNTADVPIFADDLLRS